MTEISQIVRQRLKVSEAAAAPSHPDADLLTAFAEQALAAPDRARVIQHLAQCGDCREIVALALPAEAEVAAVGKGGVRRHWFQLPALRWAAVAAGIAVAVSVGTLEHRNKLKIAGFKAASHPEIVAALQAPPAMNVRTEASAPSPESKKLAARKVEKISGDAGLAGDRATELADNLASAAPRVASRVLDQPAPSPRPAVPSARETVEVATANVPQNEMGSDRQVVSRAKPAPAQQTITGTIPHTMLIQNLTTAQTVSSPKTVPRWTIGADGTLQRSFNGGASWQVVNVPGNDSANANLMLAEQTAESAKGAGKGLDKKVAGPAGGFRAVAANGAEVWAGGSGGVLFHTVDAGNSWARVQPVYEGIVLGGDIVGIQFSDAQHGQISTSTGELWTTSDSGQTWRKVK